MDQLFVQRTYPSRRVRLARVMATCFLALSACQAKSETATDEQFLVLLGEKPMFANNPDLQISKRTIECVRLISGMDQQIYKDAPAEILGRIKTECRMHLEKKVKDTKLNPVGLALKDLEDRALADRLTTLKQRTDAQLEAKAEVARQKELAEKNAKTKDALAQAEKEAAQFANTIEAQFQDIDVLCDSWKKLKDQLIKSDKNSKYRWRATPSPCGQSQRENVHLQIAETNKRLTQIKMKQVNEISELDIPNLYYIRSFNERLSSLKEEMKAMQEMVAKVN